MSLPLERVAVLGLGLLGGSIGLAARTRGVARRVAGVGRRRDARERARALGAVDEALADPATAVRGAELVVLATPPFAMPGVLRAAAAALEPGTVVTDVASVKALVAEWLPGLLPPGVAYVGSHPMAGGHRAGLAHARADLFEGAACVVAPGTDTAPAALERIVGFWRGLGARVVVRDPETHDAEVAWVSHLPHALAFAFARALADAPRGAAELRGPGFRDFVRIARSEPELWAEILVGNRKALAGSLEALSRRLAELADLLEADDVEAASSFLSEARATLTAFEADVSTSPGAPAGSRRSPTPVAVGDHERSSETDT